MSENNTKVGRLFIPVTENSEDAKETVIRQFSEQYGGATVEQGNKGYWVDSNGELVEDRTDIVVTYGNVTERHISELASRVKEMTNEDAVMWSVEKATVGFE